MYGVFGVWLSQVFDTASLQTNIMSHNLQSDTTSSCVVNDRMQADSGELPPLESMRSVGFHKHVLGCFVNVVRTAFIKGSKCSIVNGEH